MTTTCFTHDCRPLRHASVCCQWVSAEVLRLLTNSRAERCLLCACWLPFYRDNGNFASPVSLSLFLSYTCAYMYIFICVCEWVCMHKPAQAHALTCTRTRPHRHTQIMYDGIHTGIPQREAAMHGALESSKPCCGPKLRLGFQCGSYLVMVWIMLCYSCIRLRFDLIIDCYALRRWAFSPR